MTTRRNREDRISPSRQDGSPQWTDVIIVGGSYAGLAAAMQLGRARRSVLIVDAGNRRNRFVSHANGVLGFDGTSPALIAAKGKEQVLKYPSVRWLDGTADEARPASPGFVVSAVGEQYLARRLILATGVVDDVPSIPGLQERWGKTVFHCPYCDGYELNRGKLGVLGAGPVAQHFAAIVAEWSASEGTTLFLNDGAAPSQEELAEMVARGIHVEHSTVLTTKDGPSGIEVVVRGERRYDLAALFVLPHTHVLGGFAEQLGCDLESGPTGLFYKTDPNTKETTVKGIYAAGDAGQALHSVTFAIADGARAGASSHQSLVFGQEPRVANARRAGSH